jgi:Ca2+-binding EF-hand superfamily protein
MFRTLTASSILALAAVPALEPDAEPADAATEPAPAAQPSRAESARLLVEAEFPIYDADKTGDLSQAEFSKWVLALHSKAEQNGATPTKDAAAKDKWAKDAFITADKDKSKKISKLEMTGFLQG